MKKMIKYALQDKIIRWTTKISGFLFICEIVFIGVFYTKLPPFLPLFNQLTWGEQRLGRTFELFIPVIISFIFFLSNFFLASYLYEKMPLISRMLTVSTIIIFLLSFIAIIQTVMIIV